MGKKIEFDVDRPPTDKEVEEELYDVPESQRTGKLREKARKTIGTVKSKYILDEAMLNAEIEFNNRREEAFLQGRHHE